MKNAKLKKKEIVFFSILILFIASGVAFGPKITGYTILQEENKEFETVVTSYENNISQLKSEIVSLNRNIDVCEQSKKDTFSELSNYVNKTVECETEIKTIEGECETDKEDIEKDLDTCEDELYQKKKQYSEIVLFSGNKLCCLMKVFDSGIESFDVEDYEIVCKEGRTGENRIFCEALE